MNEKQHKCYKEGRKAGAYIVNGVGRFCLRCDMDSFEDIMAALSCLPRLLYADEYLYVMRKVCRTIGVKPLKSLRKFQKLPEVDSRVAFACGLKEVFNETYMDFVADDGQYMGFMESDQEVQEEEG